jgi:hypothetical protein
LGRPVNQAFNPVQSTQCRVVKKVMCGEKGGLGCGLFSHDQILQAIYPNGNPLVSLKFL